MKLIIFILLISIAKASFADPTPCEDGNCGRLWRTLTPTPSQTNTPTNTPSFTPTRTFSPTLTPTPTNTPTTTPTWNVAEDGTTVVNNPVSINFIEPDATLVTNSPAGTARVDTSKYTLLGGRSGGQIINGGTAASQNLTFTSTSNATKGFVYFDSDQTAGFNEATDVLSVPVGSEVVPTISGSTSASGNLTLNSTTNATKGFLRFDDPIQIFPTNRTFTSTISSIDFNGTTETLNFASASIGTLRYNPTLLFQQSGSAFGSAVLFNNAAMLINDASITANLGAVFSFVDQPTLRADTKTITQSTNRGFISQPIFDVVNSGTLTNTEWTQFYAQGSIKTGATIATRRGFWFRDLTTKTGTLTNSIGFDCEDQSFAGTTNLCFRQLGTNLTNIYQGKSSMGVNSAPTALLMLGAGTATANTAPLKFTSGTNLTSAEAGAVEFTGDDYYATITTGVARKGILLNDGSNLTSTRVPFATTNGRLTDNSNMTFATDTLTVTGLKVGATKISNYNSITTVSNGVPSEIAQVNTFPLTANVGATLLYAVPASGVGLYRVSAHVVLTTAASVSSTLPNVQIVYTDVDTNGIVTIDATPILGIAGIGQTGALTANTVGTTASGVIVIDAHASSNINYQTVNYASSLAGMTYSLHIRLEAM